MSFEFYFHPLLAREANREEVDAVHAIAQDAALYMATVAEDQEVLHQASSLPPVVEKISNDDTLIVDGV